MRTNDELRTIALDFYKGLIFSDKHLSSKEIDMLPKIFMPLIFLSEKQREEMKNVGLIYEYNSKAGPMGINGYPIFSSMNCLTKEETKKMIQYYEKFEKVMLEVK